MIAAIVTAMEADVTAVGTFTLVLEYAISERPQVVEILCKHIASLIGHHQAECT